MYSFIVTDYKWNWIDEGLLPYAMAAMRAVWVGLLARLLSRGLMPDRPDLITPFMVFGLLAASIACTQCGVYVIKSRWRSVVLIVSGGLVAIALSLYLGLEASRSAIWEPGWLTFLARQPAATGVILVMAVWLWWWGILTGRQRVYYDPLTADFSGGLIMLGIGAAVAYATRLVALSQVVLSLVLFFAIGLAATAIANLQSARRFEGSRASQPLAINRYWLITVGVVIGAVLVAGLLLGQLFAPGVMTWMLEKLAIVWGGLTWLILMALVLVSYPLFALLEWLGRLVHIGDNPGETVLPSSLPDFAKQFEDIQPGHTDIPPQVYLSLQVMVGILVAAAIVLIFALAFRRFKTLLEEDVEETRELILSVDLLKEQLAQLFRRKAKAASIETAPFVSIAGDDPRAQVRRAYQSLLAWAAERGVARQPGQTPIEYVASVSDTLPLAAESVSTITAVYVQARYGPGSVSAADSAQVLRAWERIVQLPASQAS